MKKLAFMFGLLLALLVIPALSHATTYAAPPAITSIQSAGNPVGTVTAGEKASIYGTDLSGPLTVKMEVQDDNGTYVGTVSVTGTGVSNTYAEFTVPPHQKQSIEKISVVNSSGLTSNSYTVTITVPGTVGTVPIASISASPSSVKLGGMVNVSWSVSSATPHDWIGLYQIGAKDADYGGWIYTSSCTMNVGSSAKASGSCPFIMPTRPNNPTVSVYYDWVDYEFRLFGNNQVKNKLATSNTVQVGELITNKPIPVPNISYIQSPAADKNVIYSGESTTIYGTNLKGQMTVHIAYSHETNKMAAKTSVFVNNPHDDTLEFLVPKLDAATASIYITNSSGLQSNTVQVKVVPTAGGGGDGGSGGSDDRQQQIIKLQTLLMQLIQQLIALLQQQATTR
jgi:hypothetical protein